MHNISLINGSRALDLHSVTSYNAGENDFAVNFAPGATDQVQEVANLFGDRVLSRNDHGIQIRVSGTDARVVVE